jgi:arylsulfatase A-like enzyme
MKAGGVSVLAMAATTSGLAAFAKTKRPPNVIFIITDDQQRAQFNYLPEGKGRNLTPTIDRLSSEGVILDRHYASTSVCTPSRYTCLTGRYASRSQAYGLRQQAEKEGQTCVQWNSSIMPQEDTVAKRLKTEGYVTGFVGKDHACGGVQLEKVPYDGDCREADIAATLKRNYDKSVVAVKKAGFDFAGAIYHNNPDYGATRELACHNLDWLAEHGQNFIDQNKDRPFYLYFATTIPHGPIGPGRDWRADPRVTPAGFLEKAPDVLPPRDTIAQRLKKAGMQARQEQGNIIWLDDTVKALVDRLEQHGIADDTIIVYFNDHGTDTGKGSLYDDGLRTPCFIWGNRGVKGERRIDALTSNVDFGPTIAEWCGANAKNMDGVSLAALLKGKARSARHSVYGEIGYSRCVVKGDWKYLAVRFTDRIKDMTFEDRKQKLDRTNADLERRNRPVTTRDPMTPFTHLGTAPGGFDSEWHVVEKYPCYFDKDQLYNLAEDPREQKNLAKLPEHAKKLAEMQAELRQYLDSLPGGFGDLKTDGNHTHT